MNLHIVGIKKYKTIFFQTLIANVLIIAGAFVFVKMGIQIISGFDPDKTLTTPILVAMVILAVIHSLHQRKQLMRLAGIPDFDTRVADHEKFYRFRMMWFFFSVLVSCLLCIFTGRFLFLYYALFDLLMCLPYYPSAFLLKRELRSNDIVLF